MNVILSHRPSLQLATIFISPPGASKVRWVSGSVIGSIPVSRRAVAVQIVLEPDMGGYSLASMIIKPASASACVGGTIKFAELVAATRGSFKRNFHFYS